MVNVLRVAINPGGRLAGWFRHTYPKRRRRERCGGRGLRVIAGRIPAASDLVGIYEDVGTVLIALGTSSVLSFRLLNLCIRRVGDERYPNIPRVFSVRTEDLSRRSPPRRGTTVKLLTAYGKVSTTSTATHTGQYENLLRPRGVVRAASLQFESSMRE